jgi:hypothetical protein
MTKSTEKMRAHSFTWQQEDIRWFGGMIPAQVPLRSAPIGAVNVVIVPQGSMAGDALLE